jgi:hypothetical protein
MDAGPDAGPDAGTEALPDGGYCLFPSDAGAPTDGGPPQILLLPDAGLLDAGLGPLPPDACVLPPYCFSGNPTAACAAPGRCMPYEGHNHLATDVTDYPYASQPPSSGPHSPILAPWGISSTPVGRVHYVHNEEHGGIVLVYNCPSGCPDVVQAFTDLYNATPLDLFNEVKVVVTPDPEYDGGQFAAAAWDHVYTPPAGSTVDSDAFRCFISTYIDRGPERAP